MTVSDPYAEPPGTSAHISAGAPTMTRASISPPAPHPQLDSPLRDFTMGRRSPLTEDLPHIYFSTQAIRHGCPLVNENTKESTGDAGSAPGRAGAADAQADAPLQPLGGDT